VSEQPDLPPSFNAGPYQRRAPRDQEKAETKRLGMIVLGIVGLLVVGVLARTFMTARAPQATISDNSGAPVITDGSNSPVKTAPANPGGLQVAGADQDVLGGSTGAGAANGQLAPGAETPAPDQLAAQTSVAPAAAPAAPKVRLPVISGPADQVTSAAVPAVFGPAPARAAKHHRLPASGAEDASFAATGAGVVQLGALPTRADAMREWRRLSAKMPALFQGRTPHISTVALRDRTMYRLRTGGFADRTDAMRFCTEVRDQHARCELR